jgi:hypothetical protein
VIKRHPAPLADKPSSGAKSRLTAMRQPSTELAASAVGDLVKALITIEISGGRAGRASASGRQNDPPYNAARL